MAKIVIGLIGEKGGGKGSFFKLLTEALPNKKIERVSSSDLLTNTLRLWALETTRENYIKLVKTMNDGFGEGTVTNALYYQAEKLDADIVIIDSIRLQSDHDMLQKFPKKILIYITADPKTRYERTKSRGEKTGESEASFEEFMQQESAHTEQMIPEFGKKADFTINNNGSLEDFKKQLEGFIAQYNF